MAAPFRSLDYVYTPSDDVARDVAYYTGTLGAELVFAIDAMGTRVAMLRLAASPPAILLTDHLEGSAPILVYRVDELQAAVADLSARGWRKGRLVELPPGPACSFTAPGGQRLAIYASRPFVVEGFAGRRDFGS